MKPVKVPSTQALQRTTACQGSGSSTTKLSARQQSLATQGSTRFIPEASISHKPAALARPASAAAARRRHEVSQRPATAAATIGEHHKLVSTLSFQVHSEPIDALLHDKVPCNLYSCHYTVFHKMQMWETGFNKNSPAHVLTRVLSCVCQGLLGPQAYRPPFSAHCYQRCSLQPYQNQT